MVYRKAQKSGDALVLPVFGVPYPDSWCYHNTEQFEADQAELEPAVNLFSHQFSSHRSIMPWKRTKEVVNALAWKIKGDIVGLSRPGKFSMGNDR